MKNKILAIAPYEELNNSMKFISQQFPNIKADVYTADLEEGQRLALELYQDNYDVIISRGGTADLIRHTLPIPVIDVSISMYDILTAIRLAKNYTKNFIIVGYSSITEPAHLLCDILKYDIKIITLDNNSDTNYILDTIKEEKFEMILCDAITNRLALSKYLTTILITSGYDSVKRAYEEAITISQFLKKEKYRNLILSDALQDYDILIFDNLFQTYFSNLDFSLETSILKFLKSKKLSLEESLYYQTINEKNYSLKVKKINIDNLTYYRCTIKNITPPMINNRLGIIYQQRDDIEEIFATKLLFTRFIQEETKMELQKIENYYNSLIIFGETGTAKSNIAYQAFLNQKNYNSVLITIDSNLINDKMWKFLLNSSNGPLVESNKTILFKNVDKLSLKNIEQLISIVKNTKLLQRNKLIFTYDTSHSLDNTIYNRLHSSLNCAVIYAPSLKERTNELSAITTLLLNKINIENNREIMGFSPNALKEFLHYDWPGNFDQLQNALKSLVINSTSPYISDYQVTQLIKKEELVNNFSSKHSSSFSIPITLEQQQPTLFDYNQQIITHILEQNNGNQTKTAQQLGISRTTLWRYIKTL